MPRNEPARAAKLQNNALFFIISSYTIARGTLAPLMGRPACDTIMSLIQDSAGEKPVITTSREEVLREGDNAATTTAMHSQE